MKTTENTNLCELIMSLSHSDLVCVVMHTTWFLKKNRSLVESWPIETLRQKCYLIMLILGECLCLTTDEAFGKKWQNEMMKKYPPFLADRPLTSRPCPNQTRQCGMIDGIWVNNINPILSDANIMAHGGILQ